MDAERVKAWEARCTEEQLPSCAAACPLHLDARAMLDKAKAGDFTAAFAIYARVIPFPAITSHICDHPCESACRRAEAGGAIRISAIERAIVEEAYPTIRRAALRNRKPKRVAIIGGGLAGLTAAFDLAMKGHAVTVYESEPRPLERLYHDYDAETLPPSAIDADLGQLARLGIEFRCRARVTAGDGPLGLDYLIDANEAVLLAPGRGPANHFAPTVDLTPDNRIAIDIASCATSHPKVFAAPWHQSLTPGSDLGHYSPVGSMHDGRRAGLSVDRFLQGASLTANRTDDGSADSCLYVNVARHAPVPVVPAREPQRGYSHDEAAAEAARCFPCECKECVRACEFLKSYGAYPKRYVREIYNNDGIIMGNRKSNKMIDSCSMCGLCADICPNDLAMGDVVLDARRSMVARGKMPPSHHEFALLDMAMARSERMAFRRPQPGTTASRYAFFPGCQLTGSAPDHVRRIYAHLTAKLDGGVAFFQDCCGAPALWAGRQDLEAEIRENLLAHWEELGRPEIITACSSCLKTLTASLPEMTVTSLWDVLVATGLPEGAGLSLTQKGKTARLFVHDPCSGRQETGVQQSVRRIAADLGVDLREISAPERTTCCGFGGLQQFAHLDIADRTVERRAAEAEGDILAYCAMCRDNFARRGKRSVHLLDLVFGNEEDPAARPDPGYSGRRDARIRFRSHMLADLWGETMTSPETSLALDIPPKVRVDMERRLILVEDVARAVAAAEASGRKLEKVASGTVIATSRAGNVTTWVEYMMEAGTARVISAWAHRMQVEAKR